MSGICVVTTATTAAIDLCGAVIAIKLISQFGGSKCAVDNSIDILVNRYYGIAV